MSLRMETYPLTGPASASGIYLIKNKTTGQVYVGQSVDLKRRYNEWRAVFGSGLGATNPALHEAVMSTNIADWDFIVFDLAQPDELNSREQTVISKVRVAIGDKCLNGSTIRTPRQTVTANEGCTPLSTVLNEQGQKMTYAQVAAQCGVKPETIKKRLAAWRKKGRTTVPIADLL